MDIQEKSAVNTEEIARRNHLRAAFQIAFTGDAGLTALEEIGDICHFFGAAHTPEDMALQNAFKSILHHLGAWGDADGDRREIIRRLRMTP
jgi:hypothetical protein